MNYLSLIIMLTVLSNSTLHANDTAIDQVSGNVRFTKNNNIVIHNEILTIGPLDLETVRVRVEYLMENLSDKPELVEMGFPLPGCSFNVFIEETRRSQISNPRAACTTAPLMSLTINDTAVLDGRWVNTYEIDGSALSNNTNLKNEEFNALIIAASNWKDWFDLPDRARPILIDNFNNKLSTLCTKLGGKVDGKKYLRCDHFNKIYIQSVFVWHFQFPAHRKIRVVHEYLANASINISPENIVKAQKSDLFCADKEPIKAIRAMNNAKIGVDHRNERTIRYLLKPGANWAKAIEHFELRILLNDPSVIISTCFNDLKKKSPTEFVRIIENFLPTEDLGILFFF